MNTKSLLIRMLTFSVPRRSLRLGVLLAVVIFKGFMGQVLATTYYISPTGSDSSAGTSSAVPWKTFGFAIPKLLPGDTLVLRDGTYDRSNSGYISISSKNGTASLPIRIVAENERRAFLSGDGTASPLYVTGSSYVHIEGLRVKSADFSGGTNQAHPVNVRSSHHVTLRRLLVTHNNRYHNSHLLLVETSDSVLIEESEGYFCHRGGFIFTNTNNSIMRRCYVNARNYPDLPGGYPSIDPSTGDENLTIYPGSNNIIENSISEKGRVGFLVQSASLNAVNNKIFGSVSIGDGNGFGAGVVEYSPTNIVDGTLVENSVVVSSPSVAGYFRSSKNTTVRNLSVFSGKHGIIADKKIDAPGDGTYSFFGVNNLIQGNSGYGIMIWPEVQTWSLDQANSYANSPNYSPTSSSKMVGTRSIDALMSACRCWIPATSPMKNAGKSGADIGANILYRYESGVLTSQPLWDTTTGKFPHGAFVAGVNDAAGASIIDVHTRLNVNANGCLFPAGYGSSSTPLPTTGPVSADSTFSGYSLLSIDDGVVNAHGGAATTWASAESSSDHWVAITLPAPTQINYATLWWGFNPVQQKYMTSQRVEVQYWNGSAFQGIANIQPSTFDLPSSSVSFPAVTTSRLRFYQPANQGPPSYSSVMWLTEVDYGHSATTPSALPAPQNVSVK